MYSELELNQLIGEVEKEFSSYLTKTETALVKSEDDKSAKPKAEKEEEKPEAKKEDNEKKPAAKEDAPAEKQDAAPMAPPSEDAAPANPDDAMQDDVLDGAPAEDEGSGYDDEDMQHMQSMYASMSRAELIAHHDAIKAVLDGMGMEDDDQDDQSPDQSPEQPPEQSADPMMNKSETDVVVVVPTDIVASKETELLKSEIATKNSEIDKLNKNLEAVTAFVTKLVEKRGAPAGKAITQLDTIAKSEIEKEVKVLSKQEITSKLTEKASDPTLKKSDRDAINSYYTTGQINLTGISHLLK